MKEKKKKIILGVIAVLVVILGIVIYREFIVSRNITVTTGMTSTTRHMNIKKKAPTISNTQYDELTSSITDASLGLDDGRTDLNIDNIFVTSKQELCTYLSKCLGSQYINIELKKNDKKILEYFDDDFFKDNNLAIKMYNNDMHLSPDIKIASVTKEGTNATININDASIYGGPFTQVIYFNFIVLDKDITSVQFDIYHIKDYDEADFFLMFIGGIYIAILVLIIVSIIVVIRDWKVKTKHSLVKKIIYAIIIIVLTIILIYGALLPIYI